MERNPHYLLGQEIRKFYTFLAKVQQVDTMQMFSAIYIYDTR